MCAIRKSGEFNERQISDQSRQSNGVVTTCSKEEVADSPGCQ
jgi:hypothetical protein